MNKAIWTCPECGKSTVKDMTQPSIYLPTRECHHGNSYYSKIIYQMIPLNEAAKFYDANYDSMMEEISASNERRWQQIVYDSERGRTLRGERPSLTFGK